MMPAEPMELVFLNENTCLHQQRVPGPLAGLIPQPK